MIFKKPRGTQDIYENIDLIRRIENSLIETVKLYLFKEVRTPSFEDKNLYLSSIGSDSDIVSKEMFYLNSKSKNEYVLKPEGTASIARFIIENKLNTKNILPIKLFYLQNMYRYERPQKGRLREFSQFGVEIVGEKSNLIDIEAILLANNLLVNLKIKKYKILINSLGSLSSRLKYKKALIETLLNVKKCDDCNIRIKNNPLRILDCKIEKLDFNKLPKIYDFLTKIEQENLNFIIQNLKQNNISVQLENKLVRGLDYYNDIVFEIVDSDDKNFTLIGGGRYDKLLKNLGGDDLPAFGFAIGIERLKILLENENNIENNHKNDLLLYFITLNKNAQVKALQLSQVIRQADISVEINYDEEKKIKQQFKISDKLNSKYTIIIGDKELKSDKIIIKNNITKKTKEIMMNKIVEYITKENKIDD